MKDWQTLILTVVLAWIVGYGIHDWRSHREQSLLVDEGSAAAVSRPSAPRPQVRESTPSEPAPVSPPPSTASAPSPSSSPNESLARERFSEAIRSLGSCLQLSRVLPPGGSVEPTLENWLNALREDLGEPVLQTEDWSTLEIRTRDGEQRRIRIEMDYSGSDRIVRRLKYTRIGSAGEEPIPLSREQSEDPTETFIASLEADGDPTLREKAQRLYFGGGEEIVVTERNGKIIDISMNRNGRTYQCLPYDPSPEACKCHTAPSVDEHMSYGIDE